MDNTKRSIIQNDKLGLTNSRLLSKGERVDYTRVEGASLKITSRLQSPEGKRLFLRLFGTVQLQINLISGVARAVLDAQVIDPLVEAIRARVDDLHNELNKAIDGAELLFKQHGIVNVATYDTPPLEVEVPILSALARRYYEAIVKFDQLMPFLQTLQIHEVITDTDANEARAQLKGRFRTIAGVSRRTADRLRTRLFQEAKESRGDGRPGTPPVARQHTSLPNSATPADLTGQTNTLKGGAAGGKHGDALPTIGTPGATNGAGGQRLTANARKRRNRRLKREAEAAARAATLGSAPSAALPTPGQAPGLDQRHAPSDHQINGNAIAAVAEAPLSAQAAVEVEAPPIETESVNQVDRPVEDVQEAISGETTGEIAPA